MSDNENQSRHYLIKENMRWQRIEWRIQHAGFVLLLLIVLAGAAGLFSKGWLSNQSATSPDARLSVEYERFGRRESNMDLTLRLKQLSGDSYEVRLRGPQLDNIQLQTLQPQPDEAWSTGDSLMLRWHRRADQQEATVWIGTQPQEFGRYHLTVTLDETSSVRFSQFVYPWESDMETVLRAASMYLLLMVVFKVAGRRTLMEMNSFDLILLLIISEATQQALLGDDFSVTGAGLTIVTLIVIDILFGTLKTHFPRMEQLIDGFSLILVEEGKLLLRKRAKKAGIDEEDILQSARSTQGLERLDQIKFAILEKTGKISIIPKE
ncbi:hypothetical protein EIO60_01571|nr:hypothetical protein [Candidatus Pantoea persica]